MWLLRKINTAEQRSPRSRSFSCSSFKDIQSLCKDEDDDLPRQQDSPADASSLPRSPSVFHRVRFYAAAGSHHHSSLALLQASSLLNAKLLKNPDKPVIVYFTSLRVVRKAFEDCCKVRSILRGYRVPIDDRDLSMDSRYVAELREILGVGGRKGLSLPCVFVGRCYVGGEEEMRRLHESGELRAMIEGVPPSPSTPGKAAECRVCAGLRYDVCEECDGSRKVCMEKSGFRRCKACNVNGLTTCSRYMDLIGPRSLSAHWSSCLRRKMWPVYTALGRIGL